MQGVSEHRALCTCTGPRLVMRCYRKLIIASELIISFPIICPYSPQCSRIFHFNSSFCIFPALLPLSSQIYHQITQDPKISFLTFMKELPKNVAVPSIATVLVLFCSDFPWDVTLTGDSQREEVEVLGSGGRVKTRVKMKSHFQLYSMFV